MNNQVPNTDPSLVCENCHEILEGHHNWQGQCNKPYPGYGVSFWLPAAVSEVDGGTQTNVPDNHGLFKELGIGTEFRFIPTDLDYWWVKTGTNSANLLGGIGGQTVSADGNDEVEVRQQPVAPQGTVEGETRQFRKKPVVIQAIQWTGSNLEELQSWGAPATILPATNRESLIIGTLEDGPNSEAVHVASLNDWIIRGIKGEFYPCKPDVFEGTYEAESVAPPSVAMPLDFDEWYEANKRRMRLAHWDGDRHEEMARMFAREAWNASKAALPEICGIKRYSFRHDPLAEMVWRNEDPAGAYVLLSDVKSALPVAVSGEE